MSNYIISNVGSVDDIRCALRYYDEGTPKQIQDRILILERSIEYEKIHYKRSTVLKLCESKLKQLRKIVGSLNIS